jgi:hypothetical protein
MKLDKLSQEIKMHEKLIEKSNINLDKELIKFEKKLYFIINLDLKIQKVSILF